MNYNTCLVFLHCFNTSSSNTVRLINIVMQYFYECYPNLTDLGFMVRLYLIIEQIQLLSLFGKQRCTVSCAPKIGPVVFV